MKTVAFVPIKLNNERMKNKNITAFHNGRPLISYILDTLCKTEEIDEKYVYCSSEDILQYIPEGIRFLKRDKRLDSSRVKFNEVIETFASIVDADIYVLTHATAPFMSPNTIDEAVKIIKTGRYDSAFSVVKKQEFMWMDDAPINYDPANIPRTQDLKPIYFETCGLYAYDKNTIINHKRRIGERPYLIEVSQREAVDINTTEDFELADALFNYQKVIRA